MRTIKIELTIGVPSNYKVDKCKTQLAQINDLLDCLEDRYSDVWLVCGEIIGEQNDGKK